LIFSPKNTPAESLTNLR